MVLVQCNYSYAVVSLDIHFEPGETKDLPEATVEELLHNPLFVLAEDPAPEFPGPLDP